jgi:hypothetical protein
MPANHLTPSQIMDWALGFIAELSAWWPFSNAFSGQPISYANEVALLVPVCLNRIRAQGVANPEAHMSQDEPWAQIGRDLGSIYISGGTGVSCMSAS